MIQTFLYFLIKFTYSSRCSDSICGVNSKLLEKRSREEKLATQNFARISVIEELIPTLDSFAMAFKNKESWEKVDPTWRAGIEYIYGQFIGSLANMGMQKIEAIDVPCDANLHHSLETIGTDDQSKDNHIAEIVNIGYKINDQVLRPATVKIYHYESTK